MKTTAIITLMRRLMRSLESNWHFYRFKIFIFTRVKEEFSETARKHQTEFIQRAINVLDKLKEQGVQIPPKPYPLYQNYDQSCYPYVAWIFENFKDKCDFNARESLLEKHEEEMKKEDDEEKEKEKEKNDDSDENESDESDSDDEDESELDEQDQKIANQSNDAQDEEQEDDFKNIDDGDSDTSNNYDYDDDGEEDQIIYYGSDQEDKKVKSDERTILHYLIESASNLNT